MPPPVSNLNSDTFSVKNLNMTLSIYNCLIDSKQNGKKIPKGGILLDLDLCHFSLVLFTHTLTWELLWGCHMGLEIPSVMVKKLYRNRSLNGKGPLSLFRDDISCLGSHYLSMCIFFPSIGVLFDASLLLPEQWCFLC